MKKKATIAVVALVLTACLAIGGTLAWLVDSTNAVKNTFTYGDINIDLWEHKLNEDGLTLGTEVVYEESGFKMIPGNTIDKDPTVTVKAGSEACWLFVKVEESTNFDSFMTYSIATGWTALDGVAGVYYRKVEATDANTDFNILGTGSVTIGEETYTWADKEVFVLPTVEKTALNALTEDTYPTLTFTAFAVQSDDNIDKAADAWNIAQGTTQSTNN